jgi:hypothetical protein
MVARVLGAAPVLADAIIDQLAAPSDRATDAGMQCSVRPMHCFQCMGGYLEQHLKQQADHIDSTPELFVASATAAGLGRVNSIMSAIIVSSIHMLLV